MKVSKGKKKKVKKGFKRTCKVVRSKKTGRKRKVCKTVPKRKRAQAKKGPVRVAKPKPAPVPKPAPGLPVPSPAAAPGAIHLPPPSKPAPVPPPVEQTPKPKPPAPPPPPPPPQPGALPVQATFGAREAERLLWRAGFGPRPGDVERLAALGDVKAAVESFTRVSGAAPLTGAEPKDQNGKPIDPRNVWGHDHIWWLDRMVRSEHQLVERMTLIWHDWFATTNDDVGHHGLMLDQNETLRRNALGSFHTLALDITKDPAMLVFLSGVDNRRGRPNENYARELMELFTLGADRGAYTETDVRELARALTGWRADWVDGWTNFRFDANRYDSTVKTLWKGTAHQRSGTFGWQDAVRLCLENPFHPSFFVRKLWSYFVPTAPSAETQAALEALYVSSNYAIRPVVEAILCHPALYDRDAPMVKPPAVFNAGLLRARNRTITTNAWGWRAREAGQMLFYPPNVAGWNDNGWLDTSTIKGRWGVVYEMVWTEYVDTNTYSKTETPAEALTKALAHWNSPTLSAATRAELERFAAATVPSTLASWEQGHMRGNRQNALRHLIATSPDFQTA